MKSLFVLAILYVAGLGTASAQLVTPVERCNGAPIQNDRIAACTQVIESGQFTQKQVAASHNNRGFAYALFGNYDQAIADYNKSIELQPTVGFPYNNRGMVFLTLGQIDKAGAGFDQAIKLDPKFAAAFRNRCLLRAKTLGRLQSALPDCRKALELRPEDAKAAYGLGYIYEESGDVDQAVQEYRRTLRLNPFHKEAAQDLERLGYSS